MRRIPRLRRPSGLAPTTKMSRATVGPSSSSHQPTTTLATAPSSYPLNLNRLYSSQKIPTPIQETALVQTQEPETGLQSKVHFADAIEGGSDWAEERVSQGPYTAPPPRIEAARVEEVADPSYAPASFSTGLKTVGGLAGWWSRPDNWAAGGDFVGFKPREKVVESSLIEAAVRRAIIEAFALRETGREDDLVGVWPTAASNVDLQGLLAWDLKRAEDGAVILGGDAAVVAEGLRWKDDEEGARDHPALSETLTADEAAALSQTWNPSWKTISLADSRIRFAVTKRVFQLTGQLVPDHQLASITTVQTLLHVLKKPPKPATLTQELQKRHPDLLDLPNVTVTPKRVTRGDKEIALGRFKLMQEEFKKRDIPAYGHGYARKGKEISRLRGGT